MADLELNEHKALILWLGKEKGKKTNTEYIHDQ